MFTLEAALTALVESGMVDYEDAVSRSLFPNEIRRKPMTLSGTAQEPTFQPMAASSLKHAG